VNGVEKKFSFLRLVENDATNEHSNDISDAPALTVQTSFFSEANVASLGFICASKMRSETFQSLLEDTKPAYIFDLRRTPSFSNGRLSRKTVFALFRAYSIRYFDVAGALDIKSHRDASMNPALLVPKITQTLLPKSAALFGPILFFVDDPLLNEEFMSGIARILPHQDNKGWEIVVWEQDRADTQPNAKRRLVFISHANPEDNDAAKWLGLRLAAEGYEIWSDVTRLIGGEQFWDTIETVIRETAACVVVLLSEAGHEKPGVLDEVNVAVSTERRLGLKNFVIPMRIDALAFSDIRANIARKNIIDASKNLADGLHQLVVALESLGVPSRKSGNAMSLARWRKSLPTDDERKDSLEQSILIENKIKILKWPDVLAKFAEPTHGKKYKNDDLLSPFLAKGSVPGGILCFSSRSELITNSGVNPSVSVSSVLSESAFDGTGLDLLGLEPADLTRALSQIVRQSWDEHCASISMQSYELASGKLCWFEAHGFREKNEVRFLGTDSKMRRRVLVGRSEKRGVYWHFGIEAVPSIKDQSIRLKAHVIFTEDGKTPIRSTAKQHSLRRGFCKSWWNDRWRDLLYAMIANLSRDQETFSIPASAMRQIELSGSFVTHNLQEQGSRISTIEEPALVVGLQQEVLDPREGLLLYGPQEFERNPKQIRIGVVGAPEGIELFSNWCEKFRGQTNSLNGISGVRNVPFAGFEAVFKCQWPEKPSVVRAISRADLLNAIRISERHQAVSTAVGLIVDEIRSATHEDDAQVDVWFVIVPEEVFLFGRPNSRVPRDRSRSAPSLLTKRIASRFSEDTPSLFQEDNQTARLFSHHTDFHHQLKNRLLDLKAVTQLFRESSIAQTLAPPVVEDGEDKGEEEVAGAELSPARRMQDPLDVNWNIATACYFKAGGRPWRVKTARPGVCYVGLIFKQDPNGRGKNACCGAQLFLESGEGIVFKGTMGPWYSHETKQFHLSQNEATKLMSRTLEAYKSEHGVFPSELFVHGRTYFNRDELDGYAKAAPSGTQITGVRITRTSDYKLYSDTDMPVKRGTVLKINDRMGLVWTSGYIPHLGTYQGRETPNALKVELCGSTTAAIETVMTDIMTLTKMNFNSSIFADGFPVTMRFADAIGDVLMATGDRDIPPLPFRHYI
jgi:hypothetical protein